MFSATGSLLSGMPTRPDIYTIACKNDEGEKTLFHAVVSLNQAGYVPIISTISGAVRSLAALVHTIVHLAAALFSCEHRAHHLNEAKIGTLNFFRGLLEMIPIVGNIIVAKIDSVRSQKLHEHYSELMEQNACDFPSKSATLFGGNDEKIGRQQSYVDYIAFQKSKLGAVSAQETCEFFEDHQCKGE